MLISVLCPHDTQEIGNCGAWSVSFAFAIDLAILRLRRRRFRRINANFFVVLIKMSLHAKNQHDLLINVARATNLGFSVTASAPYFS